jgi:hypothetical protein
VHYLLSALGDKRTLLVQKSLRLDPANGTEGRTRGVRFLTHAELLAIFLSAVTDESEEITVAVKHEDIQEGDEADPEQHPIAIALRRQRGVDDARVSKREVLIRRGEAWSHYGAPKRVS